MLPPSRVPSRGWCPASAGLAVQRVLLVPRAVLHQLEPVGVVAPVLAGDVVAVLALLAGQGDLRTDVGGCHGSALLALSVRGRRGAGHGAATRGRTREESVGVAVTGFEPGTQRL